MPRRTPRLGSIVTAIALATGMLAAGGTGVGAATSPNGLIAYSSWDDDLNYDIHVVDPADPDAPPVRLTTDGRYNADPDWSPDGSRIVFDGWSTTSGPRIQVMDTDPATDDWRVLSDPCTPAIDCYGDFQPSWSPDGTRIAFVSSRPNADGSEAWSYRLFVMDAMGEVGSVPATLLTNDVPDEESGMAIENSQVTWSPDSSRIAFLSTGRGAETDSCDIWVMDSRDLDGDGFGDHLRQLTFDESYNCDAFEDVSPQWSPNSSLIAFTSVRTGYFDIWVVNANDPTDLRNVTQTPDGYEDQPSWSPDGTQIIFRSSTSGAYELYSLPVPGPAGRSAPPAPTQVTFDGIAKQQADWGAAAGSSAGTRILTVTRRGQGRIASDPAGVACRPDCASTFVAKTVVRLRAIPRPDSHFVRWGGACTGTLPTCRVHMNAQKSVVARFVEDS